MWPKTDFTSSFPVNFWGIVNCFTPINAIEILSNKTVWVSWEWWTRFWIIFLSVLPRIVGIWPKASFAGPIIEHFATAVHRFFGLSFKYLPPFQLVLLLCIRFSRYDKFWKSRWIPAVSVLRTHRTHHIICGSPLVQWHQNSSHCIIMTRVKNLRCY